MPPDKQAAQAPAAIPAPNTPPPASEPDHFILERLFPQPQQIFANTPPSIEELAKTCIFLFDANSFLAPFRVGAEGFADVSKILRELAKEKRLFAPAQAAREYARHRSEKLEAIYSHLHRLNTSIPSITISLPMLENTPEYTAVLESIKALKGPIDDYS